jgi:hypothetical protein
MSSPTDMDVDPIDDGPPVIAVSPPRIAPLSTQPLSTTAANTTTNAADAMMHEDEVKQTIDMMRSTEVSMRVTAAYKLDLVAAHLGPERTQQVGTVRKTGMDENTLRVLA